MILNHDKFGTLMRGKFMGKTDLFLGKVEGIADGHAIIDA
jgi:hypothetical protein